MHWQTSYMGHIVVSEVEFVPLGMHPVLAKTLPYWIAVRFWHGAAAWIPGQAVLIFTHTVLSFKCLSGAVLRSDACIDSLSHCNFVLWYFKSKKHYVDVCLQKSRMFTSINHEHWTLLRCGPLLHFSNWFSVLHRVFVEPCRHMSWTEGVGFDFDTRCRCNAKGIIICPTNRLALCSSLAGIRDITVHCCWFFSFLAKLKPLSRRDLLKSTD